MKGAVLLLVFNRPEKTRRVFEAIRVARPPRLYVAADGARADRAGESALCAQAREIASRVDWPCEFSTLFRDTNLGCKRGVSSGIDWFFEREAEGIVLEDDVLPLPGFFEYCDELLERYRHDPRVGAISGCNFLGGRIATSDSYFFSRYVHIWGWASWRRAWAHYDVTMPDWPAWDAEGGLERIFRNRSARSFWRNAFTAVHAGRIDTWDYQWQFACWKQRMLGAVPETNQTTNLGFDADATHTTREMPGFAVQSPARPLRFPLRHPASVVRSKRADRLNDGFVYGFSIYSRLVAEAMRIARRLFRR